LYETTDKSIFHDWAASFPSGSIDGHPSILPAPDHLLFHGMTKKLITAIFLELTDSQAVAAEMSLQLCLRDSLLRRTRVYNIKTKKTNNLTISDWAAVLTVSSLSFSRVLQRTTDEPLSTCFSLGFELLNMLRGLAVKLYYSPGAELDGAVACRMRTHGIPEDRLDKFFKACISLCQRPDASSIAKAIDVPNLHRMRELWHVCGRYLGHGAGVGERAPANEAVHHQGQRARRRWPSDEADAADGVFLPPRAVAGVCWRA